MSNAAVDQKRAALLELRKRLRRRLKSIAEKPKEEKTGPAALKPEAEE